MTSALRVALFTDSFQEANGVATLSREFAAFAQRRQLPFFCVHSGPRNRISTQGSVTTLELKRGFASFPLDHELYCDPLLSRYKKWVTEQTCAFHADLVHITGPGDMGVMGFWVAHTLGIPLVASWHTNLHEYAGRRLDKLFSFLPDAWRERISTMAEHQSLNACMRFYRLGRFLLAPNETMVHLLEDRTGRPAYLMSHGVDTEVYSPDRRRREGGPFRIGYVGRLTPEKNVRMLAELEFGLTAAGHHDFQFVLVGEGSEKEWLRRNIRAVELPGVLRGEALAKAFADMDAFVFPSRTDTFGLVVLEAMASGVPVVLSPRTAARAGVLHGVTGFHAETAADNLRSVLELMQAANLRREMSREARRWACSKGWPAVFEESYRTYGVGLERYRSTRGLRQAVSPL